MAKKLVKVATTLAEECCIECGISFWITRKHQTELKNCENKFYCPNGHGQHYSYSKK